MTSTEDLFKKMDEHCSKGELEQLRKYFLQPQEISISGWSKNNGLIIACENGHVNIVDYLLTSPDLIEHADLHTLDERPFKHAFHYKQFDVIKYFIYEHEIERNAEIMYYIKLCQAPSIIDTALTIKAMFDSKELHDKLNDSLNKKSYQIKNKL